MVEIKFDEIGRVVGFGDGSGLVSAEQLRAVSENSPHTAARIRRNFDNGDGTFGTTASELRHLAATGQLSTTAVLDALNRRENVTHRAAPQQLTSADLPAAAPIEVTGTLMRGQIILVVTQLVVALGALVTFLGLGETSWIVKTVRFLRSEDAVPVIGAAATVAAMIWSQIRARRQKIDRIVAAALADDRVARVTGPVHPAAQAKIEQVLVDTNPAVAVPPPADGD